MKRLFIGALALYLSACSAHSGSSTVDPIVAKALAAIEPYHVVKLDTAAIAAAVRNGQIVRLPFVTQDNRLTGANVRLTLRAIRSPTLADVYVKNGVAKTYRSIRLPTPATYQGWVEGRPGAAVFTINERVVEGNILQAPDGQGWSIIEPLEPLLRLRGVDAQQREAVLRQYDHIVYNVRAQRQRVLVDADLSPASKPAGRAPVEATPLVLRPSRTAMTVSTAPTHRTRSCRSG